MAPKIIPIAAQSSIGIGIFNQKTFVIICPIKSNKKDESPSWGGRHKVIPYSLRWNNK